MTKNKFCSNIWTVNYLGDRFKVPYCSNYSLKEYEPNLTRAIVVIHGTNRKAQKVYQDLLAIAKRTDRADRNTIIVAPQFITDEELIKYGLGDRYLYWTKNSWKSGSLSQKNKYGFRYSSYSIVDDLVKALSKKDKFPKLKEIILIGHSAGGQFVNRYAAGSPIKLNQIKMTYVVLNPSSYLYLDNKRAIEGSLNKFEILAPSVQHNCPNYNKYKYGLSNPYHYLKQTAPENIIKQYARRDVIYLLGSQDNNPNSPYLAKSCQAMLQGRNRLERGIIFYNYLADFYGYQPHKQIIISGVGHNSQKMFNSDAAKSILFSSIF
ncbi:MAG: hypothetical protein QNJ38_07065 [Prochloraceae cyanobacterium]|nr:hypothetical protein [Prochloraceae cyanobacterium]